MSEKRAGQVLGRRIQEVRESRGLSRHDVAARAKITFATMGNIESCGKLPTFRTLYRISKALECDMGELVTVVDAA